MKVILNIDGTIGAGKSTKLTEYKKKYPNITIILEPIEKWMKSGLLEKFYDEPKKYAFALQSFIIDSFTDQLEEAFKSDSKLILFERGLCSCFTIFSYLHHKSGLMTDEEYKMMEEKHYAYERDLRERGYILDHIYLNTPIDLAMERISIRNRGNEKSGISREYQQRLLDRYKELCLTPYTEEQLDSLVDKINTMVSLEQLQSRIFAF